jgi:hypothetical protein
MSAFWHDDWDQVRKHFIQWWKRDGMVFSVYAPRRKPWEDIPEPATPVTLESRWLDPVYRAQRGIYEMSRAFYGADAYPSIDTNIGPGSLGTFIGSPPHLSPETVWYDANIADPENHPECRFDENDRWFKVHCSLLDEAMRQCRGRYVVGLPDLIENIDILSQMRDPQTLMYDLTERPRWVEQRVTQINRVYFDAFDALTARIRQPWGGNAFAAFSIWGPGRTAKLQCDASAMFSADMYRRFVLPALTEQGRWLDNSLYHLDGTQAMHHLDTLLSIDALDAIEWTPQAGIEGGGHPRWYPLYKKILAAGKGVQAIGVRSDQLKPLLDACGANGMYIVMWAGSEDEAKRMVDIAEGYRR